MRCDLHHKAVPFLQGNLKVSSLYSCSGVALLRGLSQKICRELRVAIIYLVVLTIARRREPFANCKEIRVSLELIGENFTILPVTPVLLVVNKSPIWYVYPPRVILFPFLFDGGIKLCEQFM
jgi:hypothetical protein